MRWIAQLNALLIAVALGVHFIPFPGPTSY